MDDYEYPHDGMSLAASGTALVRRWRVVVFWTTIGILFAGIVAALQPAIYQASASFIPGGNDPGRTGLATIAGQFGVSIPTQNQSLSPDFYAQLLRSRELLAPIVRDTLSVPEVGGARVAFFDLFKIPQQASKVREQDGVALLGGLVKTSVIKSTGVVQLSVSTRWPSVSLLIVGDLIDGLNGFNQRTRQGQAASERKFVEGRLALAESDLRAAEDRLQEFLQTNKEVSSPQLSFQRDRLQRVVVLRQQIFTVLTQSLEDARIREVRDTPLITVVESPGVSARPEPRRRLTTVGLGLFFGTLTGIFFVLLFESITRGRKHGNTDLDELVSTVAEMKGSIARKLRRPSKIARS